MKKRIMLFMAIGILFFLGIIYAWSAFKIEINEMFPLFSTADLSLNFSITMISFCIGGFLGGKLSARYSPSLSVKLGGALIFVGLFGTSFIGNFSSTTALLLLYIFYGAIAGVGTGIGYNACVSNVAVWFPNSVGLVSGVLLMAVGFGGLFIGMIARQICIVLSIMLVFRILAVIVLVITFVGSFFIKKAPSRESTTEITDSRDVKPSEMLKTKTFWLFFCWNIILSSSGLMVINSAASISVYYGTVAALGLAVSLFNGIGRPLVGIIMDRLGQTKGMLFLNGCLVFAGAMLVVTSVTGNPVCVCVGMFLVGICYGGGITVNTKYISSQYGVKHYSVNFSIANFCIIPASFIGPYISGRLIDKSNGNYNSTFVMLFVMALMDVAVFLLLKKFMQKEKHRYV
ncbi:MAG: MFS transporter [Agathobacter sp.]